MKLNSFICIVFLYFFFACNSSYSPKWKTRFVALDGGFITQVIFGDFKKEGFYFEDSTGTINLNNPFAIAILENGYYPPWKIKTDNKCVELYYFASDKSKYNINIMQNNFKDLEIKFVKLNIYDYNSLRNFNSLACNKDEKLFHRIPFKRK
jgi:hypothetical protein